MPPDSPRPAFRWAEPLDRAARGFAIFVVAAGVLGGLAVRVVGRRYGFMAGWALAYTLLAAIAAWRVRPESWRRWWLAVLLFWAISLGAAWLGQ